MRVLPLATAAIFLYASAPAAHGAVSVVAYECTVTATGETQEVSIDVELTVPEQAPVDEQMTIGWQGTYVPGAELVAPDTGLEGEISMYAYAGISGIDGLTSATGVARLGTIVAGDPVPLPETAVNLLTTPGTPGSGTVHAASVNFGTSPQERLIECEIADTASRTEYPLTVVGADGSPTPDTSDSETPETDDTEDTEDTGDTDATDTPEPEDTEETEDTESPERSETPSGGAATGAGGSAGPDGRVLLATGLLITTAAVTGLALRRPRPRS
ncbi:hypothetical protein [Nonomuraea aridisoli]|uniref:hypothetical protein n=1 Tax=Nonomuraea aridisoli TaxID=2070368 RepID=UPI0015E8C703|nr:hypothetical protein [Nonomuraea aridisoli]